MVGRRRSVEQLREYMTIRSVRARHDGCLTTTIPTSETMAGVENSMLNLLPQIVFSIRRTSG